jgi:hypothetical protein
MLCSAAVCETILSSSLVTSILHLLPVGKPANKGTNYF